MSKNKLILFAFATNDLKKSIDRIKKQSVKSNYYDDIKIYTPNDFDQKMVSILNSFKTKDRGYGYWFWKPMFLQKIMNEIKTDDIVHYVDIGCHIQNKNNRFKHYLNFINDKKNWILAFQYHRNNIICKKDIHFENRDEYKYTKSDLLNYFNVLNNKNITHTPQFWAGSFFLKKNSNSSLFLKEWLDVYNNSVHLIDDTSSKIKNIDGFIENRHDQSIFSLLCKKKNIQAFSAYECEWGEKNYKRTWDHNFDNPILAKRDLEYSLFKRFLKRQKKNFNRLKKYF